MTRQSIQFSEEQLHQVRLMAGLGLNLSQIARILGISPATLYRKKKVIPEIEKAYEEGLAQAAMTVARTLFSLAVDERNLTALIWLEKTRFGRTDRPPESEERSQEDNGIQTVVVLPDNQRDEYIKQLQSPKQEDSDDELDSP